MAPEKVSFTPFLCSYNFTVKTTPRTCYVRFSIPVYCGVPGSPCLSKTFLNLSSLSVCKSYLSILHTPCAFHKRLGNVNLLAEGGGMGRKVIVKHYTNIGPYFSFKLFVIMFTIS